MIRFGVVLTVVLAAIGLLAGGVLANSLLMVYLAIGAAGLAAVMLTAGVIIWREEVFGPTPAVQAGQAAQPAASPAPALAMTGGPAVARSARDTAGTVAPAVGVATAQGDPVLEPPLHALPPGSQRSARPEQHSPDWPPRSERQEHGYPDGHPPADRPEQPGRSEGRQRPGRPKQQERPEWRQRPEHPEPPQHPERSDRPERPLQQEPQELAEPVLGSALGGQPARRPDAQQQTPPDRAAARERPASAADPVPGPRRGDESAWSFFTKAADPPGTGPGDGRRPAAGPGGSEAGGIEAGGSEAGGSEAGAVRPRGAPADDTRAPAEPPEPARVAAEAVAPEAAHRQDTGSRASRGRADAAPAEGDKRAEPEAAWAPAEDNAAAAGRLAQDEPTPESAPAPGTDPATHDGQAPSGPRTEVIVVPGITRYHRSQCILIRFLGAEDLEKMTLQAAEAASYVPCKACRPEQVVDRD